MRRHVKSIKQVRKPGPCRVCKGEILGSCLSVWVEPDFYGECWAPYGFRVHPRCASWELQQELNLCEARRRARGRGLVLRTKVAAERGVG